MNKELIIKDFQQYTKAWIENFNKGNFEYCINAYEENSLMVVKNVGEYKGKEAITSFWQELTKTANYIEYSNTKIEVISETKVHLSSDWKMNIGEGIITLEEWIKQEDGSWKLSQDEFEILKQY